MGVLVCLPGELSIQRWGDQRTKSIWVMVEGRYEECSRGAGESSWAFPAQGLYSKHVQTFVSLS